MSTPTLPISLCTLLSRPQCQRIVEEALEFGRKLQQGHHQPMLSLQVRWCSDVRVVRVSSGAVAEGAEEIITQHPLLHPSPCRLHQH